MYLPRWTDGWAQTLVLQPTNSAFGSFFAWFAHFNHFHTFSLAGNSKSVIQIFIWVPSFEWSSFILQTPSIHSTPQCKFWWIPVLFAKQFSKLHFKNSLGKFRFRHISKHWRTFYFPVLKPSQNEKGRKIFHLHRFLALLILTRL